MKINLRTAAVAAALVALAGCGADNTTASPADNITGSLAEAAHNSTAPASTGVPESLALTEEAPSTSADAADAVEEIEVEIGEAVSIEAAPIEETEVLVEADIVAAQEAEVEEIEVEIGEAVVITAPETTTTVAPTTTTVAPEPAGVTVFPLVQFPDFDEADISAEASAAANAAVDARLTALGYDRSGFEGFIVLEGEPYIGDVGEYQDLSAWVFSEQGLVSFHGTVGERTLWEHNGTPVHAGDAYSCTQWDSCPEGITAAGLTVVGTEMGFDIWSEQQYAPGSCLSPRVQTIHVVDC